MQRCQARADACTSQRNQYPGHEPHLTMTGKNPFSIARMHMHMHPTAGWGEIRFSACETEMQRRDKDALSDRPAAPDASLHYGRLPGVLCCHGYIIVEVTRLIVNTKKTLEREAGKRRARDFQSEAAGGERTAAWPGYTALARRMPFCGASRRNAAWGRADSRVANRGETGRPKHRGGAQGWRTDDPLGPISARLRPPADGTGRAHWATRSASRVSSWWMRRRGALRGAEGRRGSAAVCLGGAWRPCVASLCAVTR